MWATTPSAAVGKHRRVRALRPYTFACAVLLQLYTRAVAQDATQEPAAERSAAAPSQYSARARVLPAAPRAEAITSEEATRLEQHMGPAFSYAESMPGVVPVFSGVPYVLVRGATPSGSLSLFDGVVVPSLFHVALGPSIVDPELAGETRFYPAAAPAHYGAHTGGVVELAAPSAMRLATPMRSVQLSLLDVSGALNVPLQDGSLTLAARYGDPGLMMRAVNLDATLSYYDFQARYQTALSSRTQLTLLVFGAGDHLGDRTEPSDDIDMGFQRVLARLTTRLTHWELGSQLILANDDSTLGQQLRGRALRATEAMYAQWSDGPWGWRVGAAFTSALVRLERGTSNNVLPPGVETELPRDRRPFTLDPEDFLDDQPFTQVPGRQFLSAHSELRWSPSRALRLEAGLRADVFTAGTYAEGGVGPMLRLRVQPTDWLALHAGTALTQRPHTSPLPIPGLDDVALDRGLERSLQGELGATWSLGAQTVLETTFFYNHFSDVVYMELILDCRANTNLQDAARSGALRLTSICDRQGLPTGDGNTYGAELFIKRDLTQRLSGFLSYTLSFADAVARDGAHFTPQADVRHLLNAVAQYDFGHGFSFGTRLHFRTGKMAVNTVFDLSNRQFSRLEFRLPGFLRLDLRVAYAFRVPWAKLELSVSMQNVTLSREATNRDCYPVPEEAHTVYCVVDYQPFIALPNAALRADF